MKGSAYESRGNHVRQGRKGYTLAHTEKQRTTCKVHATYFSSPYPYIYSSSDLLSFT